MQVTMRHAERLTLAEMREFLAAGNTLSFAGAGRRQIYALVEGALRAQQYLGLAKKDKGVVRRYLAKISGRGLSQITRLIRCYRQSGVVKPAAPGRRHHFPRRYTTAEIELWLADATSEMLAALKKLGFEQIEQPKVAKILAGRIDISRVEDLARLAGVRYIKPLTR